VDDLSPEGSAKCLHLLDDSDAVHNHESVVGKRCNERSYVIGNPRPAGVPIELFAQPL